MIRKLFRSAISALNWLAKSLVKDILRLLYRVRRQEFRRPRPRNYQRGMGRRWQTSGFVLPTAIMVLIVISLLSVAIFVRSTDRATQVIGQTETQRVYNLATPAIERAKAKLEYLFDIDPRFPTGVPSEFTLEQLMQNATGIFAVDVDGDGDDEDPYTFPGEQRIDIGGINGAGADNAWRFESDLDGDGNVDTVVYSISMLTEAAVDFDSDGTIDESAKTISSTDAEKALLMVTRTGPLDIQSPATLDCPVPDVNAEQGWTPVSNTALRKNFQVNVYVENGNPGNRAVTALEFQQDRQIDRANKFGVWFRYDLLIHPGPDFNLNGSIHTDGNMVVYNNTTRFYLVSSPNSCIFTADASDITMSEQEDTNGNIVFQGQFIEADRDGDRDDLDYQIETAPFYEEGSDNIGPDNDSIDNSINASVGSTAFNSLLLDPMALFVADELVARGDSNPDVVPKPPDFQFWDGSYDPTAPPDGESPRAAAWETDDLSDPEPEDRISNSAQRKPYVDDTYRADDRWGPKPSYGQDDEVTIATAGGADLYGELIDAATFGDDINLLGLDPDPEFPEDVGLDGYWERRAYVQGLRIIVGQRLELGNAFGWDSDSDPLYPPNGIGLPGSTGGHPVDTLYRQQRTLYDNLAAVQSSVVYHYNSASGSDFPVACIANTAHPGTVTTLANSTDFQLIDPGGSPVWDLYANFLIGQGTNGWEFEAPGGTAGSPVSSGAGFWNLVDSTSDNLRIGLDNLAQFAGEYVDPGAHGDPTASGAFPPTQDVSAGSNRVHPYPLLTMWGNFSELRRTLDRIASDSTLDYEDLSPADQSTLHTAACSLGMLAYNLDWLENFTYTGTDLEALDNALNAAPNVGIATSGEVPLNAILVSDYDYQSVTGDLGVDNQDGLPDPDLLDDNLRALAWMVHLKEQVARDRARGFANGGACTAASFTGVGSVIDGVGDAGGLGLAKLCPNTPKFPSLYYLFPIADHDHNGTPGGIDDLVVTIEPYANDPYIAGVVNAVGSFTYNALNPADIALPPRDPNEACGTDSDADGIQGWCLPHTLINPGNHSNPISLTDLASATSTIYVPFLDVGSYDGRQYMTVRELNIDLNLLRTNYNAGWLGSLPLAGNVQNPEVGASPDEESWLPDSGIIYAFREDAVREDGIARPRSLDWTACNTEGELTADTGSCFMAPGVPRDPPVNTGTSAPDDGNGVSPKPVDYIADPDRRPHGFRLANGELLGRVQDELPATGISFITDNPVYIIGNFNLHTREEFVTPAEALEEDYSNFYTRATIDANFAEADLGSPESGSFDNWRVAEILSDAVTILSDGFCDGTIEAALRGDDDRAASDAPVVPDSLSGCAGAAPSFGNSALRPRNDLYYLRVDGGIALPDVTTAATEATPLPSPAGLDANSDDDYDDAGEYCAFRGIDLDSDGLYTGTGECPPIVSEDVLAAYIASQNAPSPVPLFVDRNGSIVRRACSEAFTDYPPCQNPLTSGSGIGPTPGGQALGGGTSYRNYPDSDISDGRILNDAAPMTVNMVMVSGINPVRGVDTYGGLHNFPRFIENWGGDNLSMSGAFIQLNFSTYATAGIYPDYSFDISQDPTASGASLGSTQQYQAPNRLWGYDVALQYIPPSPVLERLVTPATPRSELYRELDVDDPYMQQLAACVSGGC